ncbi:MAG: hypothetical protein NUW07_08605, partial [Candidatus Saccharicenans sp.]|nr:hypothetical protein [Candidatus Saccharicenans sp.]
GMEGEAETETEPLLDHLRHQEDRDGQDERDPEAFLEVGQVVAVVVLSAMVVVSMVTVGGLVVVMVVVVVVVVLCGLSLVLVMAGLAAVVTVAAG